MYSRSFDHSAQQWRDLGQPEVQNLGVLPVDDKDIRRLNVTVNDTLGMCCVESVGDLNSKCEHRLQLHRTVADHVLQRCAIQEFHGDERLSILLADVVNRANVGMIQSGRGASLTAKAFERLRITGQFFRQKLQSYKTTQTGVFGLINDTHPAAAELLDDAVMRDGLADHVDAMLGGEGGASQRDAYRGTLQSSATAKSGPVFAATTPRSAG